MSYHVLKRGEIIPMDTRAIISTRYKTITKAVNKEFWNSTSETSHSLYVGSYGRGTAIDTSDIDMLLELPKSEYDRFDIYKGNGQSRLLQVVKSAIQIHIPARMYALTGRSLSSHLRTECKLRCYLPSQARIGMERPLINTLTQIWAATGVPRTRRRSKVP